MKKPWLFRVYRTTTPPSYIGMIINHDKDPYQTTRVCGSTVDGDGCEQVLWVKCSKMTRWPSSTQLASFHTDFWKVSSLYCNIPWSPDISCVSILIFIYKHTKNIYPTPITPPSRITTESPSLLAGLGGNLAKPQPSTTPGSRHGAAAAATGTACSQNGAAVAAAVAVSHGETSETSECGDSSQGAKDGWWWWWWWWWSCSPGIIRGPIWFIEICKWENRINKHALGYEDGQHVQVSFWVHAQDMSEDSYKYTSTSLFSCAQMTQLLSEMKHMSCEFQFQSDFFRKISRKPRCLISSHLFSGSLCQVCSPKASPLSDARCLCVEERKAAAASLQGLRPSDLEAVILRERWTEPGMTYLSVPIWGAF